MDSELEAYDTAWKTTDPASRNAVCQDLADAYVAAHPELQAKYGSLTIPELVALVDIARDAGNEEQRIRLDIWINAAFEFQTIGGVLDNSGQGRPRPINVDGNRRNGA